MSAFFLEHPKETDLALFAGGESGPFARWRIERHVERCPQCQVIAADFFRLPDQLNELGELPGVDWKQMAMAIEAGVRADAAASQPMRRSGFPPLTWQAGLVTATVVVAVIVARYPDETQAEAELIAAAEIEAPAQVAPQPAPGAPEQDAVTVETARSAPSPEMEVPLAKARAERQTLASDIAAPAAPPPPAAVRNETAGRRAVVAETVADAAESAEGRLRSDAASRVGAVAALGGAAPDAANQAGAFGQERIAWAQMPVEGVDFDDAPIDLSSGYAAFAGAIAKTPSVAARNRSNRAISGFALVWIAGEADASATALVERQGTVIAPGATASSGGDRLWRLPAGITSAKMRIYVSRVSFADGTAWAPTAAEIAERGLIEMSASHAQMELLPLTYELDGQR
jgi:hypothetical protein